MGSLRSFMGRDGYVSGFIKERGVHGLCELLLREGSVDKCFFWGGQKGAAWCVVFE